jgi:pilus assembly protein CpaE
MDEPLHALCLSTDPARSSEVVALLARIPGFAITARELDYQIGDFDLHDMREPHLAIVILGNDPGHGLAVIQELHASAPATRVLALSPQDGPEVIIQAMRAGADEFLHFPLDSNALLKVCIKVSALRRAARPEGKPRGEVWVAHGARGGVGVTTLIANMAFVLQAAQRRTVLLDLDVFSGDLALFLNLTPIYTLRDVITNYRRLDSVFLQGTMLRHRSGIELLAAPPPLAGEAPLAVTSEQTLAILKLLDTSHQVALVDTSAVPLDATRAALTSADRIFLVTELTLPGLRGAVRALESLREDDIDLGATVEVVVNKYANRSWEVAPAEAAKTLGQPIRALLPRDDAAVNTAVNTGLPLVEVRGGTTLQRAIATLALPAQPPEESGPMLKSFRRLFSSGERRAER